MLAVDAAPRKSRKALVGRASPRIGPPTPAKSDIKDFREVAAELGISLMPWQENAGRVLTARGPDGLLLYREVLIMVARQQGKTTLVKPLIVRALRQGKRVMHIAQNRELPRIMFGMIADAMSNQPELFPKRRGRTIWPRYGSGQEEITMLNGGAYRIAAASRGGARGHPNDLLIFDELLEMESHDVIGAAEPTLMMSPDPQTVYLSNEGTEASVVLNALKDRAGEDEALAFLSWSAAPDRAPDDREGWAEANPAIGHFPSVLRNLEAAYRRHRIADTMSIFETENLCRAVISLRLALVDPATFALGQAKLTKPIRPAMAISSDPTNGRASAAIAWQQPDGTIALQVIADRETDDADAFGEHLREQSVRYSATGPGFDPWTDADLARHFRKPQPINGRDYANACAKFAELVESGKLRWSNAEAVAADLPFTARKPHETGAWMAVKAKEDRPITAALAAVRAVWLASGPRQTSGGIW